MAHDRLLRCWYCFHPGHCSYVMLRGAFGAVRTLKSGRRVTRTDMVRAQRVNRYGHDKWPELDDSFTGWLCSLPVLAAGEW